jgi:hypothetical protein
MYFKQIFFSHDFTNVCIFLNADFGGCTEVKWWIIGICLFRRWSGNVAEIRCSGSYLGYIKILQKLRIFFSFHHFSSVQFSGCGRVDYFMWHSSFYSRVISVWVDGSSSIARSLCAQGNSTLQTTTSILYYKLFWRKIQSGSWVYMK